MKRVLILCTGNSCRSIMAEALINAKLEGITAESSGVKASGQVNPNAQKLLMQKGIWRDSYHSKTIDKVIDNKYDLVVTVCDHAHETCPIFPHSAPKIHIGFEDPDGKGFEAFEDTYAQIENILLPKIIDFFSIEKIVTKSADGVSVKLTGFVTKEQVEAMVGNCKSGGCECMSDTTKGKIEDIQISGKDGEVTLAISGNIGKEEIQEALSKSKILN